MSARIPLRLPFIVPAGEQFPQGTAPIVLYGWTRENLDKRDRIIGQARGPWWRRNRVRWTCWTGRGERYSVRGRPILEMWHDEQSQREALELEQLSRQLPVSGWE